ncbi:MAG: hypothetical protein P4L45_04925 [Ignavibacteriaceae bacterium]|nr:hypothetical protein [Ignavibacteriaceae bacterium]
MLDTVLQIGKTFRNSPNGLKYHRYIKSPAQQKDWDKIIFLSLPVRDDFNFDFDEIKLITNEYQKRRLYYLTFKTSDADGLVKYFFGDIFYSLKDGNEGGYYRMPDLSNKQKAYQKSSFFRGEEDFSSIKKKINNHKGISIIEKFRNNFRENAETIERLLIMQAGFTEYLESQNKENDRAPKDILTDLMELGLLNAFRTYKDIMQKRNANTILVDKLKLSNTTWDEIKNRRPDLDKLNTYTTNSLFLHFDFNGKHWYEFTDGFEVINEKLLDDFVEELKDKNGFILKKYLYKTLSSPEKDLQFPRFSTCERYKNRIFKTKEEISDLIYAINYSKTALIKVPNSDIKIIALPRGNNLGVEDYDRFLEKSISLQDEPEHEEIVKYSNEIKNDTTIDKLFANITKSGDELITQFDLIISKQGGQTSPDIDIIELSGIEKSFINYISARIHRISSELFNERSKKIKSEKLKPFSIYYSFLNILGDTTKEKKKYQNHLYKVLPQIYSGTYYYDPILLPTFIEKAEQKIRNGEAYYNSFKYDFYYLTKIQNKSIEGENLMKILDSPSYKLGYLLGKLAQNFAGQRSPIKSFEKNYVGNLTRRISSVTDLMKFKNFIEEKIIIHGKNFEGNRCISLELTGAIKNFPSRYDKNECAFGFFESYFAPFNLNNEDNNQASSDKNE